MGNTDKKEETTAAAPEESVERAFERLDALIEKLEDADTPLEESFRVYQEGMELLRRCSEKISLVEKKVLQLEENGECTEF